MQDFLINSIIQFGYAAVFVCAALEAMCLPLPSEFILGFSAFLITEGTFSFAEVFAAAWTGSICGALVSYSVFRAGGRVLVYKYGKYVHLTERRLDRYSRWFERFGPLIIIPCWQFPFIRTKTSIVSGVFGLERKVFVFMTILGTGVWTGLALTVFVSLGNNWRALLYFFDEVAVMMLYIALLAVAGAIIIWYWRYFEKRRCRCRNRIKATGGDGKNE